ncbi:acetyltransferase (GNAT) family protein [Mobilisporobacter senegalensis]|uniref:Acetyltransferase (GNAT) family protein n=1 Tax=Mobilisporobacter senegalensis TaxID=1329262 RepID=A0A3N1XRA0_9FIRM|nr:GNAT family N-acetyltransferase [Mobilisporobacter senegalensis]ROR29166.1 acetyltransferase (GNAT) family protein [Mobilisporobacter senegalensis]
MKTELFVATRDQFNIIKEIVIKTISSIYPKYYPKGAVEFFLAHHSDKNIMDAIDRQEVYLLRSENSYVGTGGIKENEINRLFILPEYQGKGYGTKMMDKLEAIILKEYNDIILDASLPAYEMYIKRGYIPIDYHKILTQYGDYLCYHVMKLELSHSKKPIT